METIISIDKIPVYMKSRKQWVLWKYVERKNKKTGEIKSTKVPYQIDGNCASSNTPETWDTFDNLINIEGYDGIGFCFAEGDNLVGIDLDKCIEGDVVADWAREILSKFEDTYIEKTPSGKGFHILYHGKAIQTGAKKWKDINGVEVGLEIYDYTSPRYFTVTGDAINDEQIRDKQDSSDWIDERHFQKKEKQQKKSNLTQQIVDCTPPNSGIDQDEVIAALSHVNADDYDTWIKIGMAIQSANLPCSIWDSWSQKSSKYEPGVCDQKWNSLNSTSITIKTLFQHAVDGGFDKADYLRQRRSDSQIKPEKLERVSPKKKTKEKKDYSNTDGYIDNSEIALARQSLKSFGDGNLLFAQNRFYQWNEKVWVECHKEEIKFRVDEICENVNRTLAMNGMSELCFEIKDSKTESIYRKMQTHGYLRDVAFDQSSESINVENGELIFKDDSWQLQPHKRESYRLTLIPTVFDPSARAPRFEQYLNEIFAKDSDRDQKKETVMQFLGYSLTNNCKFESTLFLIGDGADVPHFVVPRQADNSSTFTLFANSVGVS